MVSVPIYDAGGTRRTDAMRPVQTSGEMFGASQGRALQSVGNSLQNLGVTMAQIDQQEKERDDATKVSELAAQGADTMRQTMWGEGGLMEQTGERSNGVAALAQSDAEKIGRDLKSKLSDPAQQAAFDKVWQNFSEGNINTATKFEFDQRKATRTTAKTAALAAIQNDAISNYMNEEALDTQKGLARTFVQANADGLPPEAVAQMERETISSINLSVIQRMAMDDPGMALDYYARHKGEINGLDHAQANSMIGAIANIRDVRQTVGGIMNQGAAIDIVNAVEFAESSNRGANTPPSEAGALGPMQVMPGTARETAVTLGMSHVAGMSDDEMKAYFRTPQGAADNKRLGSAYLGQMMTKYSRNGKADIEAALVAYNAGPANADKWLNSNRDYNALPKPGETLPYVRKVLGAYRKTDFGNASTSQEMQAGLNGTRQTYFNGDSKAFLKQRLQGQHGPESIDNMSGDLSDRLAAMFDAAPDYVKQGLDILSGARTTARQTELWNASDKTGKWVARPGNSKHEDRGNGGEAADLGWNGGRLSGAPKEVTEWVHANAASYGLSFPMGHEPWHIETQEARGGKGAKPNYSDSRVANAFNNNGDAPAARNDSYGRVEVAQKSVNASDLYAKFDQPFSVDLQIGGSLQAALGQVREIYKDNPTKLSEAERQITEEFQTRANTNKEQVDAIKKGLLREMITGGKSPRDADPNILAAIGPEGVTQLFNLEEKLKGTNRTQSDPATYLELTKMTPDQLRDADLMEYTDRLSGADFKSFADKQAEFVRPGNDALRSSTVTRSQIVSSVENQLGLDPNKNKDDAARMALFNRALDTKIAGYVSEKKQQPDGIVLQKFSDELMIEGSVKNGGFWGAVSGGTTKRVFDVTPEEMLNFSVASNVADIPTAVQPQVARSYKTVYGNDPNEEQAVSIYNDMIRIQAGASPAPPAPLAARIKQRWATTKGRQPLPEEIATVYRNWILRASASNGQ